MKWLARLFKKTPTIQYSDVCECGHKSCYHNDVLGCQELVMVDSDSFRGHYTCRCAAFDAKVITQDADVAELDRMLNL